MEWTLVGPEGHTVTYGVDPERGPWCAIEDGARYDARISTFDLREPVVSILVHLAQYGLWAGDDIADALAWLGGSEGLPGWPGRRRRRAPRRLRKLLRVVGNLGAAGG